MRLTNQSAVFQIWTNQRAGFGSRDNFGREAILGAWDRVKTESHAAHLATRLSGNDVRGGNDDRPRDQVKTQHFILSRRPSWI